LALARWRRRGQASLDHKQRLQPLFFPEGIVVDGNRFNRTAETAPIFKCWAPGAGAEESLVTLTFVSWNQTGEWLRRVEAFGKQL
jgi:hypothetical protein